MWPWLPGLVHGDVVAIDPDPVAVRVGIGQDAVLQHLLRAELCRCSPSAKGWPSPRGVTGTKEKRGGDHRGDSKYGDRNDEHAAAGDGFIGSSSPLICSIPRTNEPSGRGIDARWPTFPKIHAFIEIDRHRACPELRTRTLPAGLTYP